MLKKFLLLVFTALTITSLAQSQAIKDWELSYNKGLELIKSGNYKEALPSLQNAYSISQDIFTAADKQLSHTTIELADLNQSLRAYDKAAELYIKAIDIANQNKEKEKEAELYKKLGLSYKRIDYNASILAFKSSKRLIEELGKKGSLAYADILYQMSSIYKYKAEYSEAISALDSSSRIVQKLVDSTKQYPRNLTMLSQIYLSKGDFEKAIPIQEEALSHYNTAIDKTTNSYASAIFTMAVLYHEFDEYEKEVSVYKEVMRILGKNHSQYHNALNNIAQAYDRLGDFEKALEFTEQSIEAIDSSHQEYAARLQNKAFILENLGDYDEAKEVYNEALINMKNTLGEKNPKYGKLLNNVGKMYFANEDYVNARDYFKEALDVFLLNFNQNDKRYSYQLNDYAKALYALNERERAVELMKKNIKLEEGNNREDIQNYYILLMTLGNMYNRMGSYEDALPLLEKASVNTRIISGDDHYLYRQALKDLSYSYIGLDDLKSALPVIETSNRILINQIDDIFKFRSEKEKKQFLKTVSKNFDDLQSVVINSDGQIDELNTLNLNNQLMLKGLLLNNSKNMIGELLQTNDSITLSKIRTYKASKRLLSKELSRPFKERQLNIDSLKKSINTKETAIVKLYNDSIANDNSLVKNWKEARDKLESNEVAIEFSSFKYSINGKLKDSIMYSAYLYKKDQELPVMVSLFEENELLQVLENSSPNALYATRGSKGKSLSNTKRLYDIVWSPLEKHLKNVDRIYFSPSGLLNQIPFAALQKKGESILANQYDLVQLSSTSNLVDSKEEPNISTTVLIGGINYDYGNTPISKDSIGINLTRSVLKKSKGTRSFDKAWAKLPGTLNEILAIEKILEESDKASSVLRDDQATETKFKALSGNSANIIHIATHGFFFENTETDKTNEEESLVYKVSDDPLMRSGLIFSGANYAWKHGENPNEEDDGILTALEISNLDLSNTNLVVLSACETGLGDIEGSEGVYGLQRAFKMAGVDYIIMSLWEVPDKETAEFMNLFYTEWITKKKKITRAFNNAQRIMHKRYRDEPLKWAAFVLFK